MLTARNRLDMNMNTVKDIRIDKGLQSLQITLDQQRSPEATNYITCATIESK